MQMGIIMVLKQTWNNFMELGYPLVSTVNAFFEQQRTNRKAQSFTPPPVVCPALCPQADPELVDPTEAEDGARTESQGHLPAVGERLPPTANECPRALR